MEHRDNSKPVPAWVYVVIAMASLGLAVSIIWGILIRLGKIPG